MRKKYFLEVDTPVLTMPSEEGSRNFLVYYRLNPNKFFALAQSPQIYKQLLAYGGINYYQIAPVFRDEDSRKDRVNGEFYQLDVEMEADNLNKVIDFCIELVESTLKYFQISYINIGKITYQDSIETYGSDKPQKENITGQYTYKGKLGLDNPIQIWTIIKFPLTEEDSNGNRTYLNNPFTMTSRDSPDLSEQFDIVLSGIEIVSGGLRETNPRIFQNLLKLTNSNEDFDFLTRGMRSGIYQHGGFGLGLERFLLLICNHINREYNNEICNINEIIPFPLNDRKINKLMGFPKYIDMEE